jgi:hypothetical protein
LLLTVRIVGDHAHVASELAIDVGLIFNLPWKAVRSLLRFAVAVG